MADLKPFLVGVEDHVMDAQNSVDAWVELLFWKELAGRNSEIVEKEVTLRHDLEVRNQELETQNRALNAELQKTWTMLSSELDNLRSKRERAEEEQAELRRVQSEAQRYCAELEERFSNLAKQNKQLGEFWQESTSKFQAELERLERERREAEFKREQAEKKLRSTNRTLSERNKRLQEKLSRAREEWEQFHSTVSAEQARDQEVSKMKQLNLCFVKRIDEMKREIKDLEAKLSKEKEEKAAALLVKEEYDVFHQADCWQKEAQDWEIQRLQETLLMEQRRGDELEKELVRYKEALQTTKTALVASTQSAAQTELQLFHATMKAEVAERKSHEGLVRVTRLEEALEDATEEKEEAQAALEKVLRERVHTQSEIARADGERDYFQWLLFERTIPEEDWVVAACTSEEDVATVDFDDLSWNENDLFDSDTPT